MDRAANQAAGRRPEPGTENTFALGAAPRTKPSAPAAQPTATNRPAASTVATTALTLGRNAGDSRRPPENPTTAEAVAGTREGSATLKSRADGGSRESGSQSAGSATPTHRHRGRGNRNRNHPRRGTGSEGSRAHRTKADKGNQAATPRSGKPASGGGGGKPNHGHEAGKGTAGRAERHTQGGTSPRRERGAGRANQRRRRRRVIHLRQLPKREKGKREKRD